jgi:hypothetical protein
MIPKEKAMTADPIHQSTMLDQASTFKPPPETQAKFQTEAINLMSSSSPSLTNKALSDIQNPPGSQASAENHLPSIGISYDSQPLNSGAQAMAGSKASDTGGTTTKPPDSGAPSNHLDHGPQLPPSDKLPTTPNEKAPGKPAPPADHLGHNPQPSPSEQIPRDPSEQIPTSPGNSSNPFGPPLVGNSSKAGGTSGGPTLEARLS